MWPISCLKDSENIYGERMLCTPLESLAFGARLGDWSVFILDPRLVLTGA